MSFNLTLLFISVGFFIGWYGGRYSGFLEASELEKMNKYYLETKIKNCLEVIQNGNWV